MALLKTKSLPCSLGRVPLPARFEKCDGSGNGRVERLDSARQRNRDCDCSRVVPDLGTETGSLGANHQCRRAGPIHL